MKRFKKTTLRKEYIDFLKVLGDGKINRGIEILIGNYYLRRKKK